MSLKHFIIRFTLCFVLIVITACAGETPPSAPITPATSGGNYKIGKPYQVNGIWYYPKEDYSYDETGVASWYGEDFHNRKTANGELFDKDELTAAHHTLPMPSLARVTNLENGRSLVLRINDRGPFSGARIIDVSQKSAQLLGFEQQGTAKVRVQVLAEESKAIADALRRWGGTSQQPVVVSAAPSQEVEKVALQDLPSLSDVRPLPEVHQLPVGKAGQLYVQAGAFANQSNATNLQRRLSRLGQVSVYEITRNGQNLWRVRVGPAASVAEADKLLRRVIAIGIDGARIVVD